MIKFTLNICMLLSIASTHGAVVIDNIAVGTQSFATGISGPNAGGVGPIFAGSKNLESAFRFTTGPAGGDLTSLSLVISVADNTSPIVATISTGPNVPGGTNPTALGSVLPAAPSGITTISFVPGSGITLASNSEYWVHLTVPSGAGWYSMLNSNAPVESLGWDLDNSWNRPATGGWSEITSGPQARTRLEIASVPEPGAGLLGGLAFLVLLGRRR
ncbi:MAG: choice-of-anchor R domain-containing protein [Verrucomicrobiaceae bacterium]